MKKLLALALLGVAGSVSANGVTNGAGYPYQVSSGISPIVVVYVDQSAMFQPFSCGDRFVLDSSTPGGKSMLAMIVTAIALKAPIQLIGNGTCNIYPGGGEDLSQVYFKPAP